MNEIKQSIVDYGTSLSTLNKALFDYAYGGDRVLVHTNLIEGLPEYLLDYRYHLNNWPCFINKQTSESLAEATIEPAKLIGKMIRALREKEGLDGQFYGVDPQWFDRCLKTDIVANLCGRADSYHDGEFFKILELNMGTNIGGVDVAYYVPQYFNLPDLKDFFVEHQNFEFINGYAMLITNALKQMERLNLADEKGQYTIIIRDSHSTDELAKMFAEMYEEQGRQLGYTLRVFVIRDENLLVENNGWIEYNGHRVGYMIWTPGDVEYELTFQAYPDCIREAYFNGRIILPENLFNLIIADKRNLALLHQYKNEAFFSDKDRQVIEQYIPWGCLTGVETVEYDGKKVELKLLLLENKDKFVLKKCNGMQGEDVYVGKFLDFGTWSDAVETHVKTKNFMIQECVEPKNLYFQHGEKGIGEFAPVWGSFFGGDIYAGAWLRLMPNLEDADGVVNSAKGAQETIVFHEI